MRLFLRLSLLENRLIISLVVFVLVLLARAYALVYRVLALVQGEEWE